MEKLAVKLTLQAITTFFTGVKYEKSENEHTYVTGFEKTRLPRTILNN